MMTIAMIYATSQNGALGHNQTIPWKSKVELARFQAATFNKTLIIGRKTWESLPYPVERKNLIVLSANPLADKTVRWANTLERALGTAENGEEMDAVIVGGAGLFQTAMNSCHVVYKSTILVDIGGNVRAPIIPASRFKLVWVRNIKDYPAYSYQTFLTRELESKKLTTDFGLLI